MTKSQGRTCRSQDRQLGGDRSIDAAISIGREANRRRERQRMSEQDDRREGFEAKMVRI